MAHKILVLDNVDPLCKKVFEERGIEAELAGKLSADEVKDRIADYDGIVVRSGTKVTEELLDAAPKLKVVGRAGVGVDNIDIDAATARGILVMNTPDGNTISTAEHTCGMVLALARNIPTAVSTVKGGGWDRKKYMGTELHGKTIGIIGLGKIGSEVAKRLQVFGMTTVAFDPYATHDKADELGVELLDLDDVLGRADFLTVHTPLTEQTRNLVSSENADKLKKGIRLVNCARGGIYNEQDLPKLIDDGIIDSVALDVYSEEPPSDELYEVLKHPKVICTPHLGASTEEAQEKVAEQVAYQMADALEKKSFKGSLNGKSITLSTNKEVQPFLKLAEKLGNVASQIAPKHTHRFSFEYAGTCEQYSEILSDSILKGMIARQTDKTVNLINARVFAEERGFKIQETTGGESRTFNDLIRIRFSDGGDYNQVAATIFGDDDYRIVEIDGFSIELRLEGEVLLYKNPDKPGMLAAVSSTLSKDEINIGSLSLGRTKKDSEAITAVVIDKKIEENELKKINEIEGIRALRAISV